MNNTHSLQSSKARFVVGTGRCGSTLLSKMLAKNTAVCSIYELFSGIDFSFRFKPEPVSGPELAIRLREDHPMLTMTLKRGYEVPEVVYPFDDSSSQFDIGDPVPWILGIAIPRITDTPDHFFEELMGEVEQWPVQKLAVHYRRILDWLTKVSGKQCWIERSGTSIEYLPELVNMFPEAKFLHIHRDGREAALSMREYPTMRLSTAVMYGMLGDVEFSNESLKALERKDPEAIDHLLKVYPPINLYGRYWSDQIQRGYDALGQIAPENFHQIQFEDMVTNPTQIISEVAAFLELEQGDWINDAVALVSGMPVFRYGQLPDDEQVLLDDACRHAMTLLDRPMK
jgi:hypothetical protein